MNEQECETPRTDAAYNNQLSQGMGGVVAVDEMRKLEIEFTEYKKANLKSVRELLADNETLIKALSQIERGCSFPEDEVQRATVKTAREALQKVKGHE